ncbi:hypothetical protein ACG9XW_18150 [Acinetobacter guillouiae]|uniref:hypothetical protein n=1 Tax=Acinetobacter guillouiae TaxID=106649 RepID=UPI003AF64BCC
MKWFELKIPKDKKRITILIYTMLMLAVVTLILPGKPVLLIDYGRGVSERKTSKIDDYNHIEAYKYWDLPVILAKEDSLNVIKKVHKPIEKKPQLIITTPVIASRTQPIIAPIIPKVKYLGQLLKADGTLNIFIQLEEDNVILEPNQIYSQTWQVLESNPTQLTLKYLPFNQLVTVVK